MIRLLCLVFCALVVPWEAFARTELVSAATYHVNCATGSDVNGTGSTAAPWATIQKAVAVTQNTLDLAGNFLVIKVADGTCPAFVVNGKWVGQNLDVQVAILGNVVTPASVVLSGSGDVVSGFKGALFAIRGFKIISSGGSAIHSTEGSWVHYSHIEFGAAAAHHIVCQKGGHAYDAAAFVADNVVGTNTISGGAYSHTWAAGHGMCYETEGVTNLVGTPDFPGGYARADMGGTVLSHTKFYAGSATGPRFSAFRNSIVSSHALDTFPGDAPGTTDRFSIFFAGDGTWSGPFPD